MKRLHISRSFLGTVLLAILLGGCGQAVESIPTATTVPTATIEPSPIPDTSIVWSDDFEDGDLEGWEIISIGQGDFYVEDNSLKVEDELYPQFPSIIERNSPVTTGTWSIDLQMWEDTDGYWGENPYYIGLFGNLSLNSDFIEDPIYSWWENPEIRSLALLISSERLYLLRIAEGKSIMIAQYQLKEYLGSHHLDVTRDEKGQTLVYLDGKQVFDYTDDIFTDSQVFYIVADTTLVTLDNLVIRDEVIKISPLSE